jgi:hypothetical protein
LARADVHCVATVCQPQSGLRREHTQKLVDVGMDKGFFDEDCTRDAIGADEAQLAKSAARAGFDALLVQERDRRLRVALIRRNEED